MEVRAQVTVVTQLWNNHEQAQDDDTAAWSALRRCGVRALLLGNIGTGLLSAIPDRRQPVAGRLRMSPDSAQQNRTLLTDSASC